MLFSIVVPVYNAEEYLSECLASIIRQTYQDFELILVDDGSTDRSGMICDECAEEHANTIVIHKDNEGAYVARCTGIQAARGDYLLFCDSDDYLSLEMMEEIQNIIVNQKPDMVMFGFNIVNNQKKELEDHSHLFQDGEVINSNNREKLLSVLSATDWLNNMVTKATKRELFPKDNNCKMHKSLKMGEDLFQVVQLVEQSKTFTYIAKPFYHYRANPKGMSRKVTSEYLDNYFIVAERLDKLLINENVGEETVNRYYNKYLEDVFRYLLSFEKRGMKHPEYEMNYQKVIHHSIYRKAAAQKKNWNQINRALSILARPEMFSISSVVSKTVLSNKLR